tara:strand:- start:2 stop:898 length:897 start_codon:yes stop_codon:yes gene_type:complete
MRQNATIFMKGGLGNQLFQIAFAQYLKLNNYNVNINLDFFVNDGYSTPRNLIFPENFFGLKKQTYFEQKKFWLLYKLNHAQNFTFFHDRIKEYTFINDFIDFHEKDVENLYFNGYWKDLRYLTPTKALMKNYLRQNQMIDNSFKPKNIKNYGMIHVRRGDFVREGRELKIDYYQKSIEILKNNNINKYDIFTDDLEWVNNQKVFKNVHKVFSQKSGMDIKYIKRGINSIDDKNETIETFSSMLKYKHFVTGNSSFAFWAAYLKSDQDSIVTIANPLFRNDKTNVNKLAQESWYLVNNT